MNEDKPPSENRLDISSTNISLDDIESRRRMGIWHRFAKPIFYPPGSSVSTRCLIVYMDIWG